MVRAGHYEILDSNNVLVHCIRKYTIDIGGGPPSMRYRSYWFVDINDRRKIHDKSVKRFQNLTSVLYHLKFKKSDFSNYPGPLKLLKNI